MSYAGNVVKHLGRLMYGGAVPALAELIANAWDAEARKRLDRGPIWPLPRRAG